MKNRRAYLRAVPGMPIETQGEMARDAQITVVYQHGEGGRQIDARAAYIRSLREGDEAWVPRLDVLVAPKHERGRTRATTDLAAVIADILGRGAIIVDGATGITSRDAGAWRDRVEWAMRQVAAGRMTRAKARKVGAKGGAVMQARSVVTRWKSPAMSAERERWASVWRDSRFANDAERAAAMPEPLTDRPQMCRRIFGRADPKAKFTGGRPRKPRPKRKQ